jgi:small subunit ribosomal protein S20
MPRIKSAKKALRQSERRRVENLSKMKSLKGVIKNYQKLVSDNNVEEAGKALSGVYKTLDKAAKTDLIKKNRASRLKSRLAQRMTKSTKASS